MFKVPNKMSCIFNFQKIAKKNHLYTFSDGNFSFVLNSEQLKRSQININSFIFQTVKNLSPGLDVFTQSELLIEFHRMLKFGFLEGITLFSTAYDTQLRKKKAEEQNHEVNNPQDSTWSGSAKVSGPRLVLFNLMFVFKPTIPRVTLDKGPIYLQNTLLKTRSKNTLSI